MQSNQLCNHMNYSLLPLRSMRALLLLTLGLILCVGSASAQKPYTFTPSGPITIHTAGNQDIALVTITNETNASIRLNTQFTGDTTFIYGYADWPDVTIGADSSAGFPVYYRAWGGDTSTGFLRITDGVNTPDTVRFIGIDTGAAPPAWEQRLFRSWAGNYYSNTDTAYVSVRNHLNESVTITASFAANYNFDTISPQTQTIGAYGTGYFTYLFRSDLDTIGEAIVTLSGAGISDTAQIHGRGRWVDPNADDTLRMPSLLEFGSIQFSLNLVDHPRRLRTIELMRLTLRKILIDLPRLLLRIDDDLHYVDSRVTSVETIDYPTTCTKAVFLEK